MYPSIHQEKQQHINGAPNFFINVAINILSLSSRVEHTLSVPLKKFGLTLPQFNTLRILASKFPEPIILNKLTEKMIDKSSNTSRLVDKLVDKKLAFRQPSKIDRRLIHIFITENGLRLVSEVSEILELTLEKQLCSKEKQDTEELIDSLKRMCVAS